MIGWRRRSLWRHSVGCLTSDAEQRRMEQSRVIDLSLAPRSDHIPYIMRWSVYTCQSLGGPLQRCVVDRRGVLEPKKPGRCPAALL
jgi:hypothetical protein